MITVNYEFKTERETTEEKKRKDIISYAGRLMEVIGTAKTVLITLGDNEEPIVYTISGRLNDALSLDPSDPIELADERKVSPFYS